MKKYVVYFYIKENRTEYLADVSVCANTAKEACKLCKGWYYKKTGKNAFRPTTKVDEEFMKRYEERGLIKHMSDIIIEIAE